MSRRRIALLLLAIIAIVPTAAGQDGHLWVGPNVNMVSGTTFPDGDPFLQRQNEPSVAVSSRNTMNLMGFVNDYRAVDLPFLEMDKETGDAWLGVFKSFDGGDTWRSTLLQGYPQDKDQTLPLWGYEAGADPVVRAGTDGLFYLTGIVFDRGELAKSALFLTRYMDLDNVERGDPIEFIDIGMIKKNTVGAPFIDKPWMAVDVPRSNPESATFFAGTEHEQTVQCGNVYVAWAEVEGVEPNQWSTIYLNRSTDCGATWDGEIALNEAGTMAQGVTVAVSPPTGNVWVAWRQYGSDIETTMCINGGGYWQTHLDEWPLETLMLGGEIYSKDEAFAILNTPKGGHASYILGKQLIPAKLNIGYAMVGGAIQDLIVAADAWLAENPFDEEAPVGADKDEGIALKNQLEAFNNTPFLEEGECPSIPGPDHTIMAVHSGDFGQNFTTPAVVSGLHPFEQGTTEYSFRTNAYPTMTVDHVGRAYLAWTTRGMATPRSDTISGDGRIVVSTAPANDPSNWTTPQPIDQPDLPGHQFQPSITFGGGKLVLVYNDLRRDISGIFDRFIADFPAITTLFRHSVDIRAAVADPGAVPQFTTYGVGDERRSSLASRYIFMAGYEDLPVHPDDELISVLHQMQHNVPNLTMYLDGSMPFFGDYIDVAAAPPFVPDGAAWRFNSTADDGATFHAVWTDNRDVEAPHDGNWANYIPPGDAAKSVFNPEYDKPPCVVGSFDEGQTRIRNQNTYTARLTIGVFIGAPGGSRPIDALQRAYVVFVRNDTDVNKVFLLSLDPPDSGGDDVKASFQQFTPNTHQLYVEVAPYSSVSRTVFVTYPENVVPESVRVEVSEHGGGLSSSVLLNPDLDAPPPDDESLLTAETYTPGMMTRTLSDHDVIEESWLIPALANFALMNPGMMTPGMMTPGMMTPGMMTPGMMTPGMMTLGMMTPGMMTPGMMTLGMMTPGMMTPGMMTPTMLSPGMMTPGMMTPGMMTPGMMTAPPDEITWEMENHGNATTAYSFNLLGDGAPKPCTVEPCDPEFVFQLFIYREYKTPNAVDCALVESTEQQLLVNVVTPEFHSRAELEEFLTNPDIMNGALYNPTFFLGPNESMSATLWIYDTIPGNTNTFGEEDVWAAVIAQPVNTEDAEEGSTTPRYDSDLLIITTESLEDVTAGVPFSVPFTSTSGLGLRTWSLVQGTLPLTVSLTPDGVFAGHISSAGSHQFSVSVADSENQTDEIDLTITVRDPEVSFSSDPVDTPIGGLMDPPVQVLVEDSLGNPVTGYEVTVELESNSFGASAHDNVVQTDASGIATFSNLFVDRTGGGFTMTATAALEEVSFTSPPSASFDVGALVVTSTNDDGPGTLRRCIENANRNVGYHDAISFATTGPAAHTIAVASQLPTVRDPLTIDGESHPSYVDSPVVFIDGSTVGTSARGLIFSVGADNSEVRGLGVVRFDWCGIYIQMASNILVENNYLGTDGTNSMGNGQGGVEAYSCTGASISSNLISGNVAYGIILGDTNGASVVNNRIGTNASGISAIPNGADGVTIYNDNVPSAQNNTISNNLISGNGQMGVSIVQNAHHNTVAGNLIGTDLSGTSAVPNAHSGLWIRDSTSNFIGGADAIGAPIAVERNVISGNGTNGVYLDANSAGNRIQGNYIGTNVSGLGALPNNGPGVWLWGASSNIIGPSVSGTGNLISGNNGDGIRMTNGSNSNRIFGNYIGIDANGTADLGNGEDGIEIDDNSDGNFVGESAPPNINVISGNAQNGVSIFQSADNQIYSNYIGTDATGSNPIGNDENGVYLLAGDPPTQRNLVRQNVISGNQRSGIALYGSTVLNNPIEGNLIGTDASGTASMGNLWAGINFFNSGPHVIGGDDPSESNVIAGNGWEGIRIDGSDDSVISGNWIGTNSSLDDIGNSLSGISVDGSNNRIGGSLPGEGNTIAFNSYGVVVHSGDGNSVLSNSIHSNSSLAIDLDNDGVTFNDVGDSDAGPNDLINFPVLTSAIDNGTSTEVIGSVDVGIDGTPITLQFFSNPLCDSSGHGEAETYLGELNLTTGPGGTRSFTANLPAGTAGQQITATTTAVTATGTNTSEASACVAVALAPLSVTTSALSYGLAGTSYTETLLATEGFGPLTWSLAPTSPALPGTLTVTPGGNITGDLPLGFGSHPITVQVTDGTQTATKDLTLTVNHPDITFDSHPISAVSGGNLGPVTITLTVGGTPLAGVTLEIALLGPSPCSASSLTGGGPALTQTDSNGQTTWSGLSVSGGGWGYNLVVFNPISAGMASASAPFDVEGFCPTGSMSLARGIHSATLLPSGNVLVAGGWNTGSPLNSAEIYNPDDKTFSATGSMINSRANFSAERLADGRVFVVGHGGGSLGMVGEIYDEQNGTFSPTAGVSAYLGSDSTATLLPNDKVLVLGSYELFDPADQTFTLSGAFSANRRVRAHTSTLLQNGNVLIAGGFVTATGDARIPELYDPATDTINFSSTNMALARRYHTATLLPDGKVLLAGGNEGAGSFEWAELYEPIFDWTTVTGSLNHARESHAAVSLPNGEVLVVGGHDSTVPVDLASAEIYDPLDGTFTDTDSMATSRFPAIATMLNDGSVLVTGDALTNTAEIFYPIGGWMYQEADWSRQVATDNWDVTSSVDLDAGNVYLVGETQGTFPGVAAIPGMNAFVRSYDSNGIERWTDQIATDRVDRGYSVDAGPAGIAVAGIVGNDRFLPGESSAGDEDAFVRLYTAAGTISWTEQFGTSSWEAAHGVAVDSTGVYVVGETEGAFSGYTNPGGSDAYVRKYDLAGNPLWIDQFGGAVNDTIGKEAAVTTSGLYVAGETQETLPGQPAAVDQEAFVRKYDLSGNEEWTRQFGMTTLRGEYVWALAADATGVYVGGSTRGALPGQSNPGFQMQGFLRRYDASGTEDWTLQIAASDWCEIRGISVDASGLYVAGSFEGSLPGHPALGATLADAFVRKYDFDGNLIWTRVFAGYDNDFAAGGVAAGSSGVFVAAHSWDALPGHSSKGAFDSYLFKMKE